MDLPDCGLADRDHRIVSYLGGTLSDADAEAFEAHFFVCNECWRELQEGRELRAALTTVQPVETKTSVIPFTPALVTRRLPWRWVAAAATVVLVASVWRWTMNPPPPESPVPPKPTESSSSAPSAPAAPTRATTATPASASGSDAGVLRSSARDLRPTTTREASGAIRVEWPSVEKAARYVLKVFAADATLVLTHETTGSVVTIEAAALAGRSADERLFAQVHAIDALGVTLASSARIPLPAR